MRTRRLWGLITTSMRVAGNRTHLSVTYTLLYLVLLHVSSGGWSPQRKWLQTEHSSYMQAQGAERLNANGCKQNTVLSHLHFVVSCVITCKLWGLITSVWMDAKRTPFKVNYTLCCILFYSMQALGADHHLDARDWKQNIVLSHLYFLSCFIIYRLWRLITTSMWVAGSRTQFSVAYTSLYPMLLYVTSSDTAVTFLCLLSKQKHPERHSKLWWIFKMRHKKLHRLTRVSLLKSREQRNIKAIIIIIRPTHKETDHSDEQTSRAERQRSSELYSIALWP